MYLLPMFVPSSRSIPVTRALGRLVRSMRLSIGRVQPTVYIKGMHGSLRACIHEPKGRDESEVDLIGGRRRGSRSELILHTLEEGRATFRTSFRSISEPLPG